MIARRLARIAAISEGGDGRPLLDRVVPADFTAFGPQIRARSPWAGALLHEHDAVAVAHLLADIARWVSADVGHPFLFALASVRARRVEPALGHHFAVQSEPFVVILCHPNEQVLLDVKSAEVD